jgi:hypothetical protein
MVGRIAGQGCPVAGIGQRLRTRDKGRAKLGGTRSKSQGGRHAGTIHNPAGGDHRHVELTHEQADQRHRAKPVVGSVRVEDPTMTTRLIALRHDSMHPRRHEPSRLINAGR